MKTVAIVAIVSTLAFSAGPVRADNDLVSEVTPRGENSLRTVNPALGAAALLLLVIGLASSGGS